jgi:hypothetical protein
LGKEIELEMNKLPLILLSALLIINCQNNQVKISGNGQDISQIKSEPSSTVPSKIDIEAQIPSKIREALENADEFEILWQEEFSKEKHIEQIFIGETEVSGTKIVKVNNLEVRKQLLDALYQDINSAKGASGAACFIPHHTIKAKYKGEFIVLSACFQCGNFIGIISKKQFGSKIPFKISKDETYLHGSIVNKNKSKSMPIFDKIISEQNTENQ